MANFYDITFTLGGSGFRMGTDDWSLPEDTYYYPTVDIVDNKQVIKAMAPTQTGEIAFAVDTKELLIGKDLGDMGGRWYSFKFDALEPPA